MVLCGVLRLSTRGYSHLNGHRHPADGRRRASSLGCPVVPGGTVFGVLFARERGRGATRGRRAERDHRVVGLDIGFPSDASDSS